MAYEDIIKPAKVTPEGVFIGDEKLPECIEEDGVSVLPGGHKSINRLTVTFLVGDIVIVDYQVQK